MTQVWSLIDPPSAEDEYAICASLADILAVQTESSIYATPCARAFIIAQHATLSAEGQAALGGSSQGYHPLVQQFGYWFAKYMGQDTRTWAIEDAFDVYPNNIVNLFNSATMSIPWLNEGAADQFYTKGIVKNQAWDPTKFFYPAFPSVYPDTTSVLRDMTTVFAAVECVKIMYGAWATFTPSSHLTDAQLVDQVGEYDQSRANAVWGNRFTVKPNVYISPRDQASGRSWTNNIELYANLGRDIDYATVIVQRMSNLKSGSGVVA